MALSDKQRQCGIMTDVMLFEDHSQRKSIHRFKSNPNDNKHQ